MNFYFTGLFIYYHTLMCLDPWWHFLHRSVSSTMPVLLKLVFLSSTLPVLKLVFVSSTMPVLTSVSLSSMMPGSTSMSHRRCQFLKSMSVSSTMPVLWSMSHPRGTFLRRCLIHEASFLNCNVTRWRANIRCSQFGVEDGERERESVKGDEVEGLWRSREGLLERHRHRMLSQQRIALVLPSPRVTAAGSPGCSRDRGIFLERRFGGNGRGEEEQGGGERRSYDNSFIGLMGEWKKERKEGGGAYVEVRGVVVGRKGILDRIVVELSLLSLFSPTLLESCGEQKKKKPGFWSS